MFARFKRFLFGNGSSDERRSSVLEKPPVNASSSATSAVPSREAVTAHVDSTALSDTGSLAGDEAPLPLIPGTPTRTRASNINTLLKITAGSSSNNGPLCDYEHVPDQYRVVTDSPRNLQQPLAKGVDPRTYRDQDDDQSCGCFGLRKRNR